VKTALGQNLLQVALPATLTSFLTFTIGLLPKSVGHRKSELFFGYCCTKHAGFAKQWWSDRANDYDWVA
jgi:hypothetical protein